MQSQAHNEVPFFVPSCQVCQAQDETLKLVSYPFVFSVIFATFQRAFAGIFCAKHQRRYHLLASLITSTVGWFGIPFGFFLTPLTLFKLASGGIVNTKESLHGLNLIAEKKLQAGDTKGAMRCLEEYLKFQDDADIREKLTRLYSQNRNTVDTDVTEAVWQFLIVSVLLLASVVTGFLIGSFDVLTVVLLSPIMGESGSIFVAILSWLPTVTMLFFEVLLIRFLLRWTLYKGRITSIFLGNVLAISSVILAFYSILQGQSILRNLQGLFTFFSMSTRDGIFALRSILTHGGVDVLINNFYQGDLPGLIFGILFVAGTFLALYVGVETATQTAHWQNRLAQVRQGMAVETSYSPMPAWIALSSIVLGILFINVLLYPTNYVNIERAYWELTYGLSELDQNHYDKAADHFDQAVDLWPDSVTNHTSLAVAYAWQYKYEQAIQELDTSLTFDPANSYTHFMRGYSLTGQAKFSEALEEYKLVSELQPDWGLPHAELATLYYMLDQKQLEDKEIQTALDYEKDDGQTSTAIAAYYLYTLDFELAEKHMLRAIETSNSPNDYLYLARIYISQSKFDQAEQAIQEASTQGADPVDIYLARIMSAEFQNDLDTASSILIQAMQLYPDDSDLLSESSYILFYQNQIEKSAADAEKALALNPYDSQGHVQMAFAYHAQGKPDDALVAAQKAIALYPKYDRAHYILGLCYMDLDRKEEAIREFETFLAQYWERPLAKEHKENAVMYLEQLK
jgi:tetratricopeptide (TPR) repeat protein